MRRFGQVVKVAALTALLGAGAVTLAPSDAEAFCGFYVSGGEADLFNDATQVVLMRDGTKTILSMQNNYQGPVKDFAMVVPVPEVLMEANVKTLPPELFQKIDTLSAPRLVEYWERDPCYEPPDYDYYGNNAALANNGMPTGNNTASNNGGVVIEAQFEVGEYEIVILSANEATALETWLTTNSYNIPTGATDIFTQYIQQGQYFFVAKVDPAKVTFENNQAVLSPLRFDYDSQEFSLPIRLGMVNSSGTQDLIVYILGQNQRYEVSNYPNATIPTNILVSQSVRNDFGAFYTQLFDRTLMENPGAVITEYSWDASTCDPCPGPTLEPSDYATLGSDVLAANPDDWSFNRGWTLTRLHARYGKDGLDEDLVFKKADPIVGGRGTPQGPNGDLGEKAGEVQPSGYNNFQGRYIMLNPWEGEVNCSDPNYGVWGGPPSGGNEIRPALSPNSGGDTAASDTPLEDYVSEDIAAIGVTSNSPYEPGQTGNNGAGNNATGNNSAGNNGTANNDAGNNADGGSDDGGGDDDGGCSTTGGAGGTLGLLGAFGLVGLMRRRRRRR